MTSVLHTKEQGLRVHKLANLGGLVAIAGLENTDPAVLLGTLLEVAARLPQLTPPRLAALYNSGMLRLRERNAEKRAYKTSPETSHPAVQLTTEITLNLAEVKTLLIRLTGKTPVLEKDWIPELRRILRG